MANINLIIVIANFFGALSMILFWISSFRKTKKQIVGLELTCNICDVIQYLLLKSPTGAVDAGVTFFKDLSFVKLRGNKWVVFFFTIKIVFMLLFGFEGLITIISVITETTGLIALLFLSEQHMRANNMIRSMYWMAYDFIHKAYLPCIMGIGSLIFIGMSIYKNRKSAKRND